MSWYVVLCHPVIFVHVTIVLTRLGLVTPCDGLVTPTYKDHLPVLILSFSAFLLARSLHAPFYYMTITSGASDNLVFLFTA